MCMCVNAVLDGTRRMQQFPIHTLSSLSSISYVCMSRDNLQPTYCEWVYIQFIITMFNFPWSEYLSCFFFSLFGHFLHATITGFFYYSLFCKIQLSRYICSISEYIMVFWARALQRKAIDPFQEYLYFHGWWCHRTLGHYFQIDSHKKIFWNNIAYIIFKFSKLWQF